MKGKGVIYLVILLIVAVGLSALSYMGIGENNLLGVKNIKQGLDLSGGVTIVYEADKQTVTDDEMKSALSLIQGRLDRKGWSEAECSKEGEKRIRVEIPGVANADEAMQEIGQTAQLAFVDEDGKIILTGAQVANAEMVAGVENKGEAPKSSVALEFTPEGREIFAQATEENIGKSIAIILDDSIISAPIVNEKIQDGSARITGNFTPEEAENLAALIRAGSLPFNLNVLQMNNVGARLGDDALRTSITAGIIGVVLVFLFMIIIYKILGFAADWALVIYIGIELIVLSAFGITLTLPGIAGIVLSIGMAVDANVVIFERIKEELLLGKSLRSSVDTGFKRAFPAILDGNVTTLIAGFVLYILGTGTIRGFAQTLIIGIIVSMFTALFITRILIKGLIYLGIVNPKFYGLKSK